MRTKDHIQADIDHLTHVLKNMDPSDLEYGKIWDQRVDLKYELSDLLLKEQKNEL